MKLTIILTLSLPFYFFLPNSAMSIKRPEPLKANLDKAIENNILKTRIAIWHESLIRNQILDAFNACKAMLDSAAQYSENENRIIYSTLSTTCHTALATAEIALIEKRYNEALYALIGLEKNFVAKSCYNKAQSIMGQAYAGLSENASHWQDTANYIQKAINCFLEAIKGGMVEAKLHCAAFVISTLKTENHEMYLSGHSRKGIIFCNNFLIDIIEAPKVRSQFIIEAYFQLGLLQVILKDYPYAKHLFFTAARLSCKEHNLHLQAMHNLAVLFVREENYSSALELLKVTASKGFIPSIELKNSIEQLNFNIHSLQI